MISERHKCIFVHVPKVAGQSVETFFLELNGLDWSTRETLLLRFNPDPGLGPERLAHLSAKEYVKYGYLSQEKFDAFFKFSFVRNPWERIVSEYVYRKYYRKYSFKRFLEKGIPEISSYSDRYRHLMPQYDFLHDESGKILVDFVGRFEKLNEDFAVICNRLGLDHSVLPHINSRHKEGVVSRCVNGVLGRWIHGKSHVAEYYDSESIEMVAEIYKKDIETWSYKFEFANG